MGQKGWHHRGYLPHLDGFEITQHVVFRLNHSLPADVADDIDDVLDRGLGCCLLRDPRCAGIAATALRHHDGERYSLRAWCIMPNRVHALLVTNRSHELGKIVQAWKSFSARRINAMLDRTSSVWAADYFDRFMRNDAHYETTKQYIELNPVTAQLCKRREDWRFSSCSAQT
jgi:REP element-mobilizing transposase RayT